MVNVSETCRLIELALEQLMSQYNNSLNDLKREIFLLIRLVQFTNTYKPGRIQTLILPFSFELQSLVEEVVNSLYDEDLLNMKSYFLFKNISGLVYWGYSNKPFEKDSSSTDCLLITPSIYLDIASIKTIAGNSPPVKT